jgi:2-hydroxy-3-keto-5-methylthiopentenyl-1-phosphate phosphatase
MPAAADIPQPTVVFCDFDGTITRTDLTDAVLEAFAHPDYREWEQRWQAGEVGSQECLSRQVELIQADHAALLRFVRSFPIDEGIFTLARQCAENGVPLAIVSDGIDLFIQAVLQHHGLSHLPVFSNHLNWERMQTLSLSFPYARPDCAIAAGTCKCALVFPPPPLARTIVYVGDGRSDCCVATKAHRVFAKGVLCAWCHRHAVACEPFSTLVEVAHRLFPPAGTKKGCYAARPRSAVD